MTSPSSGERLRGGALHARAQRAKMGGMATPKSDAPTTPRDQSAELEDVQHLYERYVELAQLSVVGSRRAPVRPSARQPLGLIIHPTRDR